MKSSDLSQHGFGTWAPFSRLGERALLPTIPAKPGVYVLRRHKEYPRRVGTSDILYIGSATNQQGLKLRIRQYFHPGPTQRTNKRILALVGDCSDFDVSFVVTTSIPEAKILEAALLEAYEIQHGELPPQN